MEMKKRKSKSYVHGIKGIKPQKKTNSLTLINVRKVTLAMVQNHSFMHCVLSSTHRVRMHCMLHVACSTHTLHTAHKQAINNDRPPKLNFSQENIVFLASIIKSIN